MALEVEAALPATQDVSVEGPPTSSPTTAGAGLGLSLSPRNGGAFLTAGGADAKGGGFLLGRIKAGPSSGELSGLDALSGGVGLAAVATACSITCTCLAETGKSEGESPPSRRPTTPIVVPKQRCLSSAPQRPQAHTQMPRPKPSPPPQPLPGSPEENDRYFVTPPPRRAQSPEPPIGWDAPFSEGDLLSPRSIREAHQGSPTADEASEDGFSDVDAPPTQPVMQLSTLKEVRDDGSSAVHAPPTQRLARRLPKEASDDGFSDTDAPPMQPLLGPDALHEETMVPQERQKAAIDRPQVPKQAVKAMSQTKSDIPMGLRAMVTLERLREQRLVRREQC